MFERFSTAARASVVRARVEADRLDHGGIVTGHLLLALAPGSARSAFDTSSAGEITLSPLARHGVTRDAVERELARLVARADSRAGQPDGEAEAERDRDALWSIGIDVDRLREAVESAFGPGALDPPSESEPSGLVGRFRDRRSGRRAVEESTWLAGRPGREQRRRSPFSGHAKVSLELALRESIRLKDRSIEPEHLVLGLLREQQGLASTVLDNLGVDVARLRSDLERQRSPEV